MPLIAAYPPAGYSAAPCLLLFLHLHASTGLQKHTHQEPFLHWAMEIANTTNPPLVHSVSYADDEVE